jgi:S-DNA-T family DNA segregation ATPase FtsK/SpoIIIE
MISCSCLLTTRVAVHSTNALACHTPLAWSPTSTSILASGRCARWKPSCIAANRHCACPGPLPRLVVVVDEFGTMATELPEFMGALVGVAQRGRSLGVHMILATQRPSGAVNANIKANTNMSVALRVQDAHDSADVIDRPDAAEIARSNPGRAYIRLGPSEVVLVQTALSTGSSNVGAHGAVACAPFRFGPASSAEIHEPTGDDPSDLVRLVEACREAFDTSGMSLPRRPWLEMLGSELALDDVAGDESGADASNPGLVAIALADNPDHQRRRPVLWPTADGHLGLFGAVGSGTTSALLAAALMPARSASPEELHMCALDFGGGSLAVLTDLPHVGAVVAANERERQVRLIAMLAADVVRRRGLPSADRFREPQVIVVVDGLPALLSEFEGMEGQDTGDALKRVLAEGPGVGVVLALTADRPMAVSMRLLSSVTRRLLFKHSDPGDFSTIGMRPKDLPAFVPGRAIDGESRLVVQVPWVQDPRAEVDALVESCDFPLCLPARVDVMPTAVTMGELVGHVSAGETLRLPLGIAEQDRTVATVELYPGEHLLVAGQARSGVSTTLRMIGRLVADVCPDAVMVAIADERSPLRSETEIFDGLGTIDELQHVLEVAAHGDGRDWVVVVDDAHCIDDPGALAAVVAAGERCRVIVGGRADQLHGHFGHWTRQVRRSGAGLLLQSRLDTDGDLLGVRLPRRLGVPMLPGRGFVVSRGEVALVQVGGTDLAAA